MMPFNQKINFGTNFSEEDTDNWTIVQGSTNLRRQTSIIQAALASNTAPSSASATDVVDINICTRYGKQKSCCFHRDDIIRSATAASSMDDDASCLQVANTGPTDI